MMPKPLLLAALTLCCCIMTLHALPRHGCRCIRKTSVYIPPRAIAKIEVFPISGQCRHTEVKITRRNGFKVCVDPEVEWFKKIMNNLDSENEALTSTTLSPTA